jgi:hypothetical protein
VDVVLSADLVQIFEAVWTAEQVETHLYAAGFSIEPGADLKGKFGVRSEVNVYLSEAEAVVTGQPIQTYVTPILSL